MGEYLPPLDLNMASFYNLYYRGPPRVFLALVSCKSCCPRKVILKRSVFRIALLAGALGAGLFGGTIVAPNGNANVVGNDTSGALITTGISGELQILINPGQFVAGLQDITGFSFGRAEPGLGPISLTFTANIYLSTSPNNANSLPGHTLMSTTFANNVGPDNTLVFSGSTTETFAACSGPGPCPFGTNIVFTTPFLYNPMNGALLIDLQFTSFSASGGGEFDVIDCNPATNCVINSLFATPAAPTGMLNSGNNIVQITYDAVTGVKNRRRSSWRLPGWREWAFMRAAAPERRPEGGKPGLADRTSARVPTRHA